VTWILVALIVLSGGFGAVLKLGLLTLPAPAIAFFAVAGIFAVILVLSLLPLKARRPATFVTVFIALAAMAGFLYYFQFYIKPNMVKGIIAAAFAPKPTAVSAEAATVEQWPPKLLAIGSTRAFEGIDVAPQVAGIVTAIHFKSSDVVAAGAPLIQLDDSTDLADLKNGQAQLKNAEISLDRQQTLSVGGNTAKAQVDTAIAARDSAAATVEKTQAVIAQKNLTAPFAGRLGISKVDLGQYIAVGTSIVTLQQLDPIYVDFQTPEQSLSVLAVGQDVSMTLDAYPGQPFSGKIKAIDARVSADTRNFLVRAEFANSDRKLLPGMFANLDVTTGAPKDVVTVPRTAIVYSLYGDNVYVVKPAPPKAGEAEAATTDKPAGLIVERRFVRTGATRGERVAIDEGVGAGDQVVTTGQIKLQPNSAVTLDSSGGLPKPAETPKP
jgi:membrane fusion protein (multidrug efflux system)